MARLKELTTAEELHLRDMADPIYRAEHERSRFANEVAVRVLEDWQPARKLTSRENGPVGGHPSDG